MAKAVKVSGKPSAHPSGRAMVPQPHGGALLPGAGGGPQPGSGRPPSEVKRRALKAFDEVALPVLEELAVTAEKDRDKIAAANVLAKAGFSDAISKLEVRKALGLTVEAIRTALGPEKAEPLLAAIRPFWTVL